MKDRIIFLDYDGVVNNAIWHKNVSGDLDCFYNFPKDNAVNNYQAICWLNHLYEQYPYDIVVCSSWREDKNYKECLYNAGLNKDIKILGCTDIINGQRDDEIYAWLVNNDFKGNFAILDDDEYYYELNKYSLKDHLVLCNQYYGFLEPEYNKARRILAKHINKNDDIKHYHHYIDTPYEVITEYEVIEECNNYKKVQYTCFNCKEVIKENINNDNTEKSVRCPCCKTHIRLIPLGELDKHVQHRKEVEDWIKQKK